MSKTMTRRLIAGASAVAVAAGMAVTLGAGAAGAEPISSPTTWEDGNSHFERKISNTKPKPGDVITVTTTMKRKWGDAYVYAFKDVHPDCLTYVGPDGPEVVASDPLAPGTGFVKVAGSWRVPGAGSGWGSGVSFNMDYKVGDNCARNTDLMTTAHVSGYHVAFPVGNFSSNYAGKGPTFSMVKNATTLRLEQLRNPLVNRAIDIKAQAIGAANGDQVKFFANDVLLGTGTVGADSIAVYSWTPNSVGQKKITATFEETSFANAAAGGPMTVTVGESSTSSSTLIQSISGAQVGIAKTVTVGITPAGSGGEVILLEEGHEVGRNAVVDGKATISWVPQASGTRALRAEFSGRPGVDGSDTTEFVSVAAEAAGSTSSSTSIRVDGIATAGEPILLVANVDPKNIGGTVTFSDNGVQVGSADVGDGGVAAFWWTPSESGPRTLTALFSGVGTVKASSGTADTTVLPGVGNPGNPGGGDTGSLGSLSSIFGSLGSGS